MSNFNVSLVFVKKSNNELAIVDNPEIIEKEKIYTFKENIDYTEVIKEYDLSEKITNVLLFTEKAIKLIKRNKQFVNLEFNLANNIVIKSK